MRARILCTILIAAFVAIAQGETTPDYSAADAGKHIGETATVTDKAERVNTASGGNVFIDMGGRHPNSLFTVFIGAKDAEKVGDVKQYEGKTITVSGKIVSHKDKPEIVVTSASQITVKDDSATKK